MAEVMEQIRARALAESPLLAGALRPDGDARAEYAGRCGDRYLLGVEMIREGYLLHHGSSRLFTQEDRDLALLTGDYLYAAGLVEICATGDLDAVRTLALLIAECSARRGELAAESDEPLWDAAVTALAR
ncbi:MAG TPA: hypothetical protein VGC71_01830 [Gaiellales bacterium]|jgi:hypothetical protein